MRRPRLLFFLLLIVGSVGCDHATKHLAHEALTGAAPISLIGNVVRLELASNPGAFLSLGAELPEAVRFVFLVGGVPFLLALVCVAAFRTGHASSRAFAGLALITGGGLANWFDRILHDGAVTDFVSLGIPGLRTGIFNLADLVIVVGFLLFAFQRRAPEDSPAPSAT